MENKKYSLLIVGLYCYYHIAAIINHLKERNPLVDVTLLTDKPDEMKKKLRDESITIVHYEVQPIRYIFNRLGLKPWVTRHRLRKFMTDFSKNRRYDIVNVQCPNRDVSFVYKQLRALSDNIVVTPWGSEVLRQDNKKILKQLGRFYRQADYIATAKRTPLGKRIIDEFKVEPNKIIDNFFGTDIIDFAIKNGDSILQEDAKQRFGLAGRYVITCGYNQRRAQRHKEIIDAISQVRGQLPENLTLLFPMSYGKSKNETNLDECKKTCKERGIDALFITEFLTVEDTYKMRKATDMFIHVQPTDASSASVQEYILCDKKIIHGSWIKYEELEKYKPLFYFPVDRMEDLGEVIVKAYHSNSIEIPQGVIDYVKSSGWESKTTKMNNFFMSIV